MTVLNVIKDVCTAIGLRVPTAVMASTQREHVELKAVANEVASRIAFDSGHDWTKLKALATLTGNGTDEGLSLPSDFKRMLKKASVWPTSSPLTRLDHVPDTDTWLSFQVQDFTPLVGAWTLIGTKMHFLPVIENAATVKFYYISKLIVDPAAGDDATEFSTDTDVFKLDERLLKLGMIWEWKHRKGQPYAEHMASYEDALAQAIGNDQGSNILTVGGRRTAWGAEAAYPGTVGQ